jgi:hypothetical protein
MIQEVGQSRASAEALARLSEASTKTAFARIELRQLNREVRAARARLRAAEAAEAEADAAFYATPYGDPDA